MLRKFLATALLVVSLHAQTEKFQVIANDVSAENEIMVATGNVVIFSPTYYITAQKIIYDKKKGTFELFDDVIILRNNNVQTKSDYAFLDVNTDDLYQKPSMLFEEKSSIWINSKDSKKKEDRVFLDEALLSSCDCVNPDWSIRVSSADYDTKDKWINAYNPRLYFKDVPVLYAPYIGFSSDKSRRTGLLVPTVGYSKSEGGFYSQPIYFAPAPNYDLEFIPQYRAKRGSGIYAYYRYADTINSVFKISAGYFNEDKKYKTRNNLRNEDHYGLDVEYKRYNLFTGKRKEHKDGLFIDINYLNDIEYRTLEDEKYKNSSEKEVESKINYIYNTPSYFFGSYFRYYINTNQEDNSNTLQELPKLQAHSYSRPFLLDRLLYSADVKYTNHTRESGLKAHQYELNLPLSYSMPLFDDYLTFIIREEFTLNKYQYSSGLKDYKDGTYIENNTVFSLSSDLIKPYENYLHTVNLNTNYTKANIIKKDGNLFGIKNGLENSAELSPFPITKSSDSISFGLNQSLYDKNSLKQIINHKLTQSILYDEFDDPKFQNMENEIVYNYILGSVKNRLVYNHQDERLVESSSSFSLTYENFEMKLGHYMSKKSLNAGIDENLESYQFDAKYKLSNRYSLGFYTDYNIEEKLRNKLGYKFSIADSCWNLDLKYEKEIKAASTTNNSAIKQNVVYLELLLKPIGGIKQKFELDKEDVN